MPRIQRPGPAYPRTRHLPLAPADLTDRETRARLSGPAVRAFFSIMAKWQVKDQDARVLLGGVTNGPYYELKRHPGRVLDTDRLTRVSLLVGIFKALNILYSEPLANAWPQLPNTNRLFGGASPLEYMMRGGVPAMLTVRRLLDARRAG